MIAFTEEKRKLRVSLDRPNGPFFVGHKTVEFIDKDDLLQQLQGLYRRYRTSDNDILVYEGDDCPHRVSSETYEAMMELAEADLHPILLVPRITLKVLHRRPRHLPGYLQTETPFRPEPSGGRDAISGPSSSSTASSAPSSFRSASPFASPFRMLWERSFGTSLWSSVAVVERELQAARDALAKADQDTHKLQERLRQVESAAADLRKAVETHQRTAQQYRQSLQQHNMAAEDHKKAADDVYVSMEAKYNTASELGGKAKDLTDPQNKNTELETKLAELERSMPHPSGAAAAAAAAALDRGGGPTHHPHHPKAPVVGEKPSGSQDDILLDDDDGEPLAAAAAAAAVVHRGGGRGWDRCVGGRGGKKDSEKGEGTGVESGAEGLHEGALA
ncbi:unnamed protein product [Vitrella brassicaformis CCMP3155]|uniref:Uncharacterized protein n=1 Tax=Vitrella brassicaformis (strain CCMP3155) TaxID=1169540 RepID=A0A0G4GRA9_VITBC|nr:unnamed protein product [Vitrella brassicaformis CCMP3155]|eukprot:CEM33061.1 unnamed protein product [Vitrella brassicaformis CCMP3155]